MSFSTANLPQLIVAPAFGGGRSVWLYRSSDPATAITAAGYFAACGEQPSTFAGHWNAFGGVMRYGDVLLAIESSAGSNPGRATWHGVLGSTASVSATQPLPSSAHGQRWNATVAAHAST